MLTLNIIFRGKKNMKMKISSSLLKFTCSSSQFAEVCFCIPVIGMYMSFRFCQIIVFQNTLPHTEIVYILIIVSASQGCRHIAIGVCLTVILLFLEFFPAQCNINRVCVRVGTVWEWLSSKADKPGSQHQVLLERRREEC